MLNVLVKYDKNLARNFFAFQLLIVIFVLLFPARHAASSEVTGACDAAARIVASDTGVPIEVLMAITRTETGRTTQGRFSPWPWTMNTAGSGEWFASREDAVRAATENIQNGISNFDVGCFQINYRWHGDSFNSIAGMFDPEENARYAAGFLLQLFSNSATWTEAVGKYHSLTPSKAIIYLEKYSRILNQVGSTQVADAVSITPGRGENPRSRNYPLFQSQGGTPVRGSLFQPASARNETAAPFLILNR